MKLECINISSNNPEKLAEFYRKLGVNVFVRGDNYDGFNSGNVGGETIPVSITIGTSGYENGQSIDRWIQSADNKLYVGKNNGKDQVVF